MDDKLKGIINNQGGVVNFGTINGSVTASGRASDSYYKSVNSKPDPKNVRNREISTSSIKKILREVLCTDSELDSFCQDFFPEVYREFSSSMDTTRKLTILCAKVNPQEIFQKIEECNSQKLFELVREL